MKTNNLRSPLFSTHFSAIQRLIFAGCGALLLAATTHAEPLPAEGAWQTGLRSEPPKEGVDRIFLVNRQWIEGRVAKIDPTTVTFEMAGQTQTFPRAEVSVMQLTDWLSPEKRQDKQEVKVRIVCEGEAEAGTLLFTRGAIIAKVDVEPKFIVGTDSDDKAGTDRTSIWFEKGGGDRTITTLTTDVTLLVPAADVLSCEVLCNRANGFAGPFHVRLLNPADGKELVSLKRLTKEFWSRLDIPLAKLKAGSSPAKVDCIPFTEIITRNIPATPPLPAPATTKDTTATRIVLFDSQAVIGRLLSLDGYSARVQTGLGQAILIPRDRIACIELNDWEAAYRNGNLAKAADPDLTAPLAVTFAGTSALCELTLAPTESIAKLIVPPHFVTGWDRDDLCFVKSERALSFEKTVIDRSPSQVEATVILRVTNKAGTEIAVRSGYSGSWAGDLRVSLYDALTKRGVETSGAATQTSLDSTLKISRGKLLPR